MTPLETLVADELAQPVHPRVRAMAAAIAANHPSSVAVLFYGSCLRDATLSGMLDFYLIVEDYARAYDRRWLATANRLLPPNVFPFAQGDLTAKYAVLDLADLERECSLKARSTSVWARFAQPARLAWSAPNSDETAIIKAVAQSVPTFFERTLPVASPGTDHSIQDLWIQGFGLTYSTELRAERASRPEGIIAADPDRYDRFAWAALASIGTRRGVGPNGEVPNLLAPEEMRAWWRSAARKGKALTIARLAKASLTFAGGIDYLAWKIARHSGQAVAIRPWQRRYPLLAALVMLPRLVARGQIR